MTTEQNKKNVTAKPFVKWAGGKGALIKELVDCLPSEHCIKQEQFNKQ